MSDDLVYRIFVEMAVLEGKRDTDGKWLIGDVQEVQRLLRRAFTAVVRASSIGEDETSGATGRPIRGAGMPPNRP